MYRNEKRKEKTVLLAQFQDHIKKIIIVVLTLLFLTGAILASIKIRTLPQQASMEKFFFLCVAMILSFGFGVCLVQAYLPGVISRFTDFLLAPKRYLKKAAPLLSHPRNLIMQRRYEEAEESLCTLLNEYPLDPALNFFLAELYTLHIPDPGKMEILCRNYFENGPVITAKANIQILLLYTDLLIRQERTEDAICFLERELTKKIYLPDECNSIRKRLSVLTGEKK